MQKLKLLFTLLLSIATLNAQVEAFKFPQSKINTIQEASSTDTLTLDKFELERTVDADKANGLYRLIFFDNYINYVTNDEDSETQKELLYLTLAGYFKKKSEDTKQEQITKRAQEVKAIMDNDNFSPSEKANLIESKIDEINNRYELLIDEYYRRAVGFWCEYRLIRGYQGPIVKNNPGIRTQYFYERNTNNGFKFLNSFNFNLGFGKNASIYSELYRDYFGPIRVSVGAMIANNSTLDRDSSGFKVIDKSERKDDIIQRLSSGGGNMIIGLSYPLYYKFKKNFTALAVANLRNSIDLPILGTESGDVVNNHYGYLNGGLYYGGLAKQIMLYVDCKFGYQTGSKKFFEYLNVEESNFIRNRKGLDGYFYGQLQAGIILNNTFRLGLIHNFGEGFVSKYYQNSFTFSLVTNFK